ncbi:MAG: ribose 5-phosphate isomerase B [Bacteroidetes bacterium]|nr:ribose 5-phosphate isomerase B [Bacteroidota bacterium]
MFDRYKTIPIGCDHAGYKLKEYLIKILTPRGFHFMDFGTHSEESVDYPDFVHPVARSVNDHKFEAGIIICGSGNGSAMTANKYANIRAAICWNKEIARLARLHNDANIITLPGRFIGYDEAIDAVEVFFSTDFEGGRHLIRIEKIPKLLK